MRIISGSFKGFSIDITKEKTTRPLKDITRESIFNLLAHSNKFSCEIKKCTVLDLYAGTGSFGLECISRGSSKVLFVENNNEALVNLKKNISDLSLLHKTAIYPVDVLKFLKDFDLKKKIELIFLDPPYKDKNHIKIIEIIKEKQILSKDHILLLHIEKGKNNKDFTKKLNIIDNRVYGRSEILFFKLF